MSEKQVMALDLTNVSDEDWEEVSGMFTGFTTALSRWKGIVIHLQDGDDFETLTSPADIEENGEQS